MKKKLFSILLITTMLLSGCTSVIELTSEEEDLVAEYAAGVVVKKYKESEGIITEVKRDEAVTDADDVSPQETTGSAEADSSQGASTEAGNVEVNDAGAEGTAGEDTDSLWESANVLTQVLGVEGVELSVLGYTIEEKYPLEEYMFSVEPTEGHKLLVVEYDVWNSVDADSIMKLNTDNVVIKAVINGSENVSVYKTMLNNDILNMNETSFAPGEAKTGVLIFNISDELAEEITSLNVTATAR